MFKVPIRLKTDLNHQQSETFIIQFWKSGKCIFWKSRIWNFKKLKLVWETSSQKRSKCWGTVETLKTHRLLCYRVPSTTSQIFRLGVLPTFESKSEVGPSNPCKLYIFWRKKTVDFWKSQKMLSFFCFSKLGAPLFRFFLSRPETSISGENPCFPISGGHVHPPTTKT